MSKIRAALITPVILGFFIWHSTWFPDFVSVSLNYLLPCLVALVVIHEIYYVVYMHRAFISLGATIVRTEDSTENNLTVRNYDVTSEFMGQTFTRRFSESALANDLAGRDHCHILVRKLPPHIIFIDSFKIKYINLIFSLMLVLMMYYYYTHPE